jgi:hypothetical protein
MAFQTLKTRNSAISLDQLERDIARQKSALPDLKIPRNSGTRRTQSKRALLKAIEETGAKW